MKYLDNITLEADSLFVDGEKFIHVSEIGRGKSAVSHLFERRGRKLTLKKYTDTEQNQIPFEEALDFEILSYERLVESGVAVPKLIGYNRDSYIMVKEYIEGPVLIDFVAQDRVTEDHFQQMFAIQYKLQKRGYHVDFYPANFVLSNGRIYCIDYETHIYLEEWDFINWGIFYWLNCDGIRRFLKEGDPYLINRPDSRYKPYEEEFLERRDELVEKFRYLK